MARLYILLSPSYTKEGVGGEPSQEPPLSHAERYRGMPEVQRRLAGMKSFASGAKPAASFHFKRLSIRRCHLWRRRRTLERIF